MFDNFLKKQLKENPKKYFIYCIIVWSIVIACIWWYKTTPSENCCNQNNCTSITIKDSLKQGCGE